MNHFSPLAERLGKALFFVLSCAILLLVNTTGQAQVVTTEKFLGVSAGSAGFTSNGQTFTISSQVGHFFIDKYNGYDNDNCISNAYDFNNYIAVSAPRFTISSSQSFKVNTLAIAAYLEEANQETNPTITITGKLSGSTVFSETVTNLGSYLGSYHWRLVNFANLNEHNWSTTNITDLVIASTSEVKYLVVDDFTWTSVPVATAPSISTNPPNRSICAGNGTTFSTVATGTATITYQWQVSTGGSYSNVSNGGVYSGATTATLTLTGVTNGMSGYTYKCVATSSYGTATSSAGTLTVSSISSGSSSASVSCYGGSNGQAAVPSVSGGIAPYTYSWSPSGGTSATATGLAAGNYTCTITDNIGCSKTQAVTVTQPTSPVSGTTVVTNLACSGGSTGAINLTPTGGTGPYTFNWLPSGPTTEDRTGLSAGTYSVTITDANGCTGTVTATVTQPATPVSGTTVVTNVACFGGNTGAINLTPTGGVGPYTFFWLPSGPTTEDRTGLIAGTYSVQITDANGCTGTVTATATQPATPVSGTTVVTNVACFGGNTGSINLTPTGGTPGYTYDWLPSGPTLLAGTYSIQITDANGCTGTVTATVTQPSSPVSVTKVVTNVACFGGNTGAINLTTTGGTPGYTYIWLPSGLTMEDRTGLSAGNYNVQITDGNGCTSTVTATVTQPSTQVSGTTVVTNIACFGGNTGAINLTPASGTGPYTFNWLPSGPTTEDRTGLVAGTYSVQITDANGCAKTVTATVTQPSTQVSGTTVVTNIACFGGNTGAINLTPTGGTGPYTFNWLPSGPTTEDRTGLVAGTYSVQITDANGCTGTVTATVTQPSTAVYGTAVVTNVACTNGSNGAINLSPMGGVGPYTFQWLPSGPTTEDRTNLVYGTYLVQITDANGCIGTLSATVNQPSTPVSGTTVVTNIVCYGGSTGAINLTAAGGTSPYTYNWTDGPTAQNRTGLTAGTYSLTITDANGCSSTSSVTVDEPSELITRTTVTHVKCFNRFDGAIDLSVNGGTFPYIYNWNGGVTTQDRTGINRGNYSVTVTDGNGCQKTANVTISEPPQLNVSIRETNIISCNGGDNGQLTASVIGGTPGYLYNWSSGSTSALANGLHQGNYYCSVTDANGCIAAQSFTIREPSAINISVSATTPATCGQSNGSATVSVSGGTPGYLYNWSSGSTNDTQTNLAQGTYSVTITDHNGCSATQTVSVSEVSAMDLSISNKTNPTCFEGNDGAISISVSGGASPYSYDWSGDPLGDGTASVSGLSAGTYAVTVTDDNNCASTTTITLTDPSQITVTLDALSPVCANEASFALSGGFPAGGTYSGAGVNNNNFDPAAVTAGTSSTITYSYTDANGCSNTASQDLLVRTLPVLTFTTPDVVCEGTEALTLTASPAGGTFSGTNVDGNLFDPIAADNYILTYSYTDANGCINTAEATAEVKALPAAIIQTNDPTSFCDGDKTTLTVDNYPSIKWYLETAPVAIDVTSFDATVAGNYSVEVVGENGCANTSATIAITLYQNPTPTISYAGNDPHFCDQQTSLKLSATNGFVSYQWYKDEVIINGATTKNYDVTGSGNYTVTVFDSHGCTGTSLAQEVTGAPPIQLLISTNRDPHLCNGESITLSSSTATTYTWYKNGNVIGGATQKNYSTNQAGTYHVVATDGYGCSATSSDITVVTNALPQPVITTPSADFCVGGETKLSTMAFKTYKWRRNGVPVPGAAYGELTVDQSGNYTVEVTNENGCKNTSALIKISENPLPNVELNHPGVNYFCDGSNLELAVPNTSAFYQWLKGNETMSGETSFTLNATQGGSYRVTAITDKGCVALSSAAIIFVKPSPEIPMIILNEDSTLRTTSVDELQWYKDGQAINGATTTTYKIESNGVYRVVATNGEGCSTASEEYNMINLFMNEVERSIQVLAYPNPMGEELTLESNTQVDYKLLDVNGKVVASGSLKQGKNHLGTHELAKGVYQLVMVSTSSTTGSDGQTSKVVRLVK